MSLKRNILANYVSQIYVTLIGIVMVPLYVRYMGAEAYGLVGFFAMMQAWFQLLDMGLTPTMARAAAAHDGGPGATLELRKLLRVLEYFFVGIAIIGACAVFFSSTAIATSWLKVQTISLEEVRRAVALMGLVVALRWISGLYRGAINGFERMVWLGSFNMGLATARFVLVIPLFIYVSAKPILFFSYQLAVALVELVALVIKTYSLLPNSSAGAGKNLDWKRFRGLLRFSLSIAFTSSVWVLVTQTDKLVLSKLLSLTDYGYFTLSVLVASGVTILSGPVSAALLPRMTNIAGRGDDDELYRLYSKTTQLVGVITIPASLVLAFFAEQVLWAWTGNVALAQHAAPILALYSLGNGILALAAFPYYLQYAKGDLRLHLIGNLIFVLALIPVLIYATSRFGVIGAGCAWFIANLVYFLLWVPKVHRRFKKGLHSEWLRRDVGMPIIVVAAAGGLARNFVVWPQDRLLVAVLLVGVGFFLVFSALLSLNRMREQIFSAFLRRIT